MKNFLGIHAFGSRVLLFTFFSTYSFSLAQNYGGWRQIDSLIEARYSHSAIQLADGNVLVVGGAGAKDLRSCEIYDTFLNRWSEAAKTNFVRGSHRLIMLDSKRVLAVGSSVTKSAEIYDLSSNKWILTDSLKVRKGSGDHQIVKLLDGRILVIGGYTFDYRELEKQTLRMCEVYDEKTGKWNLVDSLKTPRHSHSATLLKDGRVLVTGGRNFTSVLRTCEIYDPNTNKWTDAAPMNIARENPSAVLLPSGKVFVGNELYNSLTNTWTLLDSLQSSKTSGIAFIIDDRNILIVGSDSYQTLKWEIYDYVEFKSKYVGAVNTNSFSNTIAQLKDGRVLVSGGITLEYYPLIKQVKRCWIFGKNFTGVEGVIAQADNDVFFQNYPNPFNPVTRISFSIPQKSQIKLKVFDVLGREISLLADGVYEAGKYEVEFNASNLPSGVYFYNLTTASGSFTKKMMVIK